MRIAEINSVRELGRLWEPWQRLYERCPSATPFQSPDWLIPWWNHIGGGELMVLAAHDGERLAGLAPLYIQKDANSELRVLFLGTGISDYLDFICEPESAALIPSLFIEHLWAQRRRWDVCNFQELRRGSPLLEQGLFPSVCSIEQTDVCPVLNLPPNSSSYWVSLAARLRRSLTHSRRKLIPVCLEQPSEEAATKAMEVLFYLHRKRWLGRGQPGVLDRPEIQAFHRQAAASFSSRSTLGLYVLRSQGIPAAVLYGFRKAPRFYAYLSGFDPELDSLSPGAYLTYSVIEDAIRSGLREFDFLRGGEKYKYGWGAVDSGNFQLTVASPRVYS